MIFGIETHIWIVGLFLLVMAMFDAKYKKIPSVLGTTGILFCSVVVVMKNPFVILLGLLGFVLAYLLYEFEMFNGMADIKAIVLVSLTLASVNEFLFFMIFLSIISLAYQGALKYIFKFKHKEEIPLVPVFFLTWVLMLFF